MASERSWRESVDRWRAVRPDEEAAERELGITLAQLSVLLLLAEAPERRMTMKAIGEAHACTPAVITGVVDRIEKAGYVERLHGTDDRRSVFVELTAKGRALADTALGVESPKSTPRRKRAN